MRNFSTHTALTGLIAGICLLLLTGCGKDDPSDGSRINVGNALPSFRVELTDGTAVTAADFSGRGGLICFFNTGCTDCRMELPALQSVREGWSREADAPIFLLIARAQTDPDIAAYWSMQHYTMPYAPQADRSVFDLFAESGIPRIYIVGTDGRVRKLYGETSYPSAEQLLSDIAAIGR